MKTLLKLLGFFIVVNFLTIGCTKIALDEKVEDITDGGAFNQANVKEWYYAVFKKSAEWKSSPEAGKKLPIWGEGFYRKVGDMEIIEFPLWKHTKVYSTLFPMGAIISEQEKERVVKSALHRIIFLRDGNGKVYVREQVFTPSYEYARKKNYDFNELQIGNNFDFTGELETKEWGGKIISKRRWKDGKDKGTYTAIKGTPPTNTAQNSTEEEGDDCQWQQVCEATLVGCVIVHVPDLPDREVCTWLLSCDYVFVCGGGGGGGGGGGDDPPEDCSYWGGNSSSPYCLCLLYGICGGGGGDDPPEEPVAASYNFENKFAVKISGSSGTNENWSIKRNVTINGMKFTNNPANNYYTTFAEASDCYYDNYNPAYGGYNGNPNSTVYCYSQGGCLTNSSLIYNDKRFTNTSSAVVYYPNYREGTGPLAPFYVSYSNTKQAIALSDFN